MKARRRPRMSSARDVAESPFSHQELPLAQWLREEEIEGFYSGPSIYIESIQNDIKRFLNYQPRVGGERAK
jgi:hypothetical protein